MSPLINSGMSNDEIDEASNNQFIIDKQKARLDALQPLNAGGKRDILIKMLPGEAPTDKKNVEYFRYNWIPYASRWDKVVTPIYTRGILLNEILIDTDSNNYNDIYTEGTKFLNYLKENKIPHDVAFSGGKGIHISIIFDTFSISDDIAEKLNEFDIDVYSVTRMALVLELFKNAGVDPLELGVDWKKINFNIQKKGSQVREFGTTRGEGKYKTLITSIPKELPKPNELPLVFPGEPKLWHIGKDYLKAIMTALKAEYTKSEQRNEYVTVDIDTKGISINNFPCHRNITNAHIANGRYYAAVGTVLLARQCGYSKEEALIESKKLLKTCKGLDESGISLYSGNAITIYDDAASNFSCRQLKKDLTGIDICDFKNCPYCDLLKTTKAKVTDRISAVYGLDGIVWSVGLVINGKSAGAKVTSKKRLSENSEQRNKELTAIIKIVNAKDKIECDKDELAAIVFDIMSEGAKKELELIIKNKDRQESIEKIKDIDNEVDLLEDPKEMLISSEIKERAKARALDIMTNGNPMQTVIKTIGEIHVGDERITEALCLGLASQSCLNTQGIQPSATGESGSGKSHNIKAFCHTVPKKYIMETSLTPKALYYSDEVKDGTIIFSDDTGIDEEMETIIKRATTNYQETTKHTTVVKQEGKSMSIPSRIMWMFSSVESEGSEQLLNRQITLNTDESKEHKGKIFDKQVVEAITGEIGTLEVNEDILIARNIHDMIKSNHFNVVIPYADNIRIANMTNTRNFPLFLDMVRGYAVYNFKQRATNEKGYLIADKTDFAKAKVMFESLKENIITKMSPDERRVLIAIGNNKFGLDINEIIAIVKLPYQKVRYMIEGRKDVNKPGLLDRMPDLTVFDQSESVKNGSEGYSGTRSKKYILRNYNPLAMFDGEFVWLEDDKA